MYKWDDQADPMTAPSPPAATDHDAPAPSQWDMTNPKFTEPSFEGCGRGVHAAIGWCEDCAPENDTCRDCGLEYAYGSLSVYGGLCRGCYEL